MRRKPTCPRCYNVLECSRQTGDYRWECFRCGYNHTTSDITAEDAAIRAAVVELSSHLSDDDKKVDIMQAGLADESPEVRSKAAIAVGKEKIDPCIDQVRALLLDKNEAEEVRALAATALCAFEQPGDLNTLIRILEDDQASDGLREGCLTGICSFSIEPAAVAAMAKHISEVYSEDVRLTAIHCAGGNLDPFEDPIKSALLKCLDDPSSRVSTRAFNVLHNDGACPDHIGDELTRRGLID